MKEIPPSAEEAEATLYELYHRTHFITPAVHAATLKYLEFAVATLKQEVGMGDERIAQRELVRKVLESEVGDAVEGLLENTCILAATRMRWKGRKVSRRAAGNNTFKVTRVL